MTKEGREYRRRKQEGSDEETDRKVRETINEMKRELENGETPEKRELPEQTYCPDETVREAIKEIKEEEAERLRVKEQKESEEESQESKEKVKVSEEWDVDRCVREAVNEVQQEERERQRLREEREHAEMEKEQQREASREARKETADSDELDEYEKRIRESYEKHGIDPEEVRERWRKKFEEEVQDELGEESKKKTKEEGDESAGSERTAEGRYYYDDGSGQVYEVQMDSKESSSTETESNGEVQEKIEDPQPEIQEDPEVKKESEETESKEQGSRPVREEAVQESPTDQEVPEGRKTKTRTKSSEVHEEPQRDSEQKKDVSEVREGRKQKIEAEDQEASVKTRDSIENTSPQEGERETEEVPENREEQSTIDEYSTEVSTVEEHEEQGTTEESSASQEHQPEHSIEVPEDFDRHIEELLEDLISELESEEETEESEQVKLRRRLAKLFGELSEEEREKFKEEHRPKLETEEDLDELIENDSSVRVSPDFKEKYEEAKEYIRSGKQGEVPKLIKELLRDAVERAWSKIVLDRLGEALARRLNPEMKTKELTHKESAESRVYPVNMWVPELDGVRIESYDHLVELLKSRSPAFFKRKDADKLLKSARLHIELYQEYGSRTHLERGEVATLSKKLKKSPTTLKRYLRQGVMPKVYYWSNMVPSGEREEKLKALLARLNGVTTEEEYDRRFSTLFFHDEMSTTVDHRQKDEFARKFFTFLSEYMKSGLLIDLAKRLKIGKSTIGAWFDGTQLPTRIAYASLIPQEEPREGFRWLPKRLNTKTNLPEDFIQLPVEIRSAQDILDVLNQILPLNTKTMRAYEKELGEMSKEIAFMYLLGLMVSDGSFRSDVDYSASANLFVSKKYSWGTTLGKGFCYTMGKIGLSAKRDTDQEKVRENGKVDIFQVYNSEASPVLMWMKKALLGLKASETKKELAIKADWILNMLHDWKVAFIQGLADGDGHASIPRFDTAIATNTNKKFFKKLFSSVGIVSRFTDHHVKIGKYEAILKARELPLFRFASGRQEILNDICKIIELRPKGRLPIPEDEKKLVMDLYQTGLTKGEIVEKLWHEHGLARTTAMIDTLIRRENKKLAD